MLQEAHAGQPGRGYAELFGSGSFPRGFVLGGFEGQNEVERLNHRQAVMAGERARSKRNADCPSRGKTCRNSLIFRKALPSERKR